MDMNDILARLQNGETSDDIAKDLTTMLNSACKQYNEEKAKAEAEAKAKADLEARKAKQEKMKLESFCLLFEDFKTFLHEFYGYEYEDLDKIAAKDVLAVIDAYAELSDWTISFANKIGNHPVVKTTIKKPVGEVKATAKKAADTVDDVIAKFLDEMKW